MNTPGLVGALYEIGPLAAGLYRVKLFRVPMELKSSGPATQWLKNWRALWLPAEEPAHRAATAPLSVQPPLAPVLLAAFCLALLLPNPPTDAFGTDLDSSWQAVLGFAHDHHWQWGRELAFTFGPLGFLFTPGFTGSGLGLRLILSFLVSFVLALGVCQLAWRMEWGWRLLLLWLFVAIFIVIDTTFEIGLVCWGLVCVLESGRRAAVWRWVFAVLVAVLSLWKFSLAVMCGATLAAVAGWHLLHGKRRVALGLVAGTLAVFLLCWFWLGQRLSSLWPYLHTSFLLTNGYNLTMGNSAPREFRIAGVAAVSLTVLVILLRTLTLSAAYGPRRHRVLLAAWLSFVTFLAWKHGFVRTQGFEAFFFGLAALLLVALQSFPTEAVRARRVAQVATIAVVLLGCAALDWRAPGVIGQRTGYVFGHFSRNLRMFIHPRPYQERLNQALVARRQQNQLPKLRQIIGRATVDVFGQNQAFALLNDLNYKPRPVFQSYCAYTRPLMSLNQRFYEGTQAPEYVLFNLAPIDERPPGLEDSAALRTLLTRYEPIESERAFLLLKRSERAPSTLVPLRQGSVRRGEPIVLDGPESCLWLEVSLRPSWWGKIEQTLYRPPKVYFRTWHGAPLQPDLEYRVPAAMAEAGMLVRPFLTDTLDIVDLYTGTSNKQPAAVSLDFSGSSSGFYQEPFAFRLYRIEPPLGRRPADTALARLRWPGFRSFPIEAVAAATAPLCFTTIAGKAAIRVQPGGFLKFALPPAATQVIGAYGFEEVAYTAGTTDGAEFRVELRQEDGSSQLLFSQLLEPKTKPADRGLHPFIVDLPPGAQGQLLLRTLPGPRQDPTWDLVCWADIEIK